MSVLWLLKYLHVYFPTFLISYFKPSITHPYCAITLPY